MGVIERREREREEVRRKILTAARDLFASEGYDRVTMRRIADAIEYSATTIYNHFEDKDDLVQALCQEDFDRLFQHLQETAPPADPVEAVRQLHEQLGLDRPLLTQYWSWLWNAPRGASKIDAHCVVS